MRLSLPSLAKVARLSSELMSYLHLVKTTDLSELRALIRDILQEDMAGFASGLTPQAHAILNKSDNTAGKRTPPPLPTAAQKPASVALPQKGALNKFKSNVNMAVDAANRVKEAVDGANTKEALRWIDKLITFATSAKDSLGVK